MTLEEQYLELKKIYLELKENFDDLESRIEELEEKDKNRNNPGYWRNVRYPERIK